MPRLVLFLLLSVVTLVLGLTTRSTEYPGATVDYTEYATAPRLLQQGDNPYDGETLLREQQATGWPQDKAQMMWNPPWVFPLVLPLAWLPWKAGYVFWVLAQVASVACSMVMLARLYDVPTHFQRWVMFPALLFAPSLFLLILGQSSGFLLLGLVGFVYALEHQRPLIAGALLALLGFKPHLFFALLPLWGYEFLVDRRVRIALLAGLGVLVCAGAFPMLWRTSIWQDYVAATQAPGDAFHLAPNQWDPPILAGRLSALLGDDMIVQFAPSAVVGLVLLILRTRGVVFGVSKGSLPLLVLLALLFTGYGAWGFDLVLLLIPLFDAANQLVKKSRQTWLLIAAGTVTANVLMLLGQVPVIWWTPCVAAVWVVVRYFNHQNQRNSFAMT